MRPVPTHPPYQTACVPDGKRWLSVCALLLLLSGGGMALLLPAAGAGWMAALGMMGAVVVMMGGCWLIRQLYYRVSVHNAWFYDRLAEQQQQAWWVEHQQYFVLSEVVLSGPAGANPPDWLNLLKREHQVPDVRNEENGRALRIARMMVDQAEQREAWLAKVLVLQWQVQRISLSLPLLQRCYWQGSLLAWRAFCAQMQVTFPDVVLPDEPEEWRGEESLSALATAACTLPADEAILVAGCHSVTASFSSALPAGESAALWLVSHDGPVCLTRGEVYDSVRQETITAVSGRAEQQSELENPPEVCLLFSQPALPELIQTGWNVNHHVQDLNWGNPGDMEMLIVLTLAAIYASHYQQPCGWIAKDPLHTLALGIIKPYDEGKSIR